MIQSILCFLALSVLSFSTNAFTVAIDKSGYIDLELGGRTSGHEEISRQAMILVKDELENIGVYPTLGNEEIFGDLDPEWFGTKGSTSPNMIIRGNYATDFPKPVSGFSYPLDLVQYWKFPNKVTKWRSAEEVDWHNNPEGQTMHGLRNYINGQLQTAYEACTETQNLIIKVSRDAVRLWQSNQRSTAAFLMGHATHILQDSFSPAHVSRTNGLLGNSVDDFCYYGTEQKENLKRSNPNANICYHEKIDLRDVIFIRDKPNFFKTETEWRGFDYSAVAIYNSSIAAGFAFTEEKKRLALKHESRLAKVATARYLYIIARYISESRRGLLVDDEGKPVKDLSLTLLNQRLKDGLFEGSVDDIQNPMLRKVMPAGALNCTRVEGR